MKAQPYNPSKPPPGHPADLSEPWNLVRFATLVTLGTMASSLAIGAGQGTLDGIVTALTIAGLISLAFWGVTLFAVWCLMIPALAGRIWRGVARRPPRRPAVRGGLADEWLDGPV